jgi:rhamnogalacturonyl hydrolase YesR
MKHFISWLGVAATASAAVCPSPLMSVQGANTIVLRDYANGLKSGAPFVTYEHGVAWRALEMVYNVTQNASYVNHIQKSIDNLVTSSGGLNDYDLDYYTLDDIRIGETLIYM